MSILPMLFVNAEYAVPTSKFAHKFPWIFYASNLKEQDEKFTFLDRAKVYF